MFNHPIENMVSDKIIVLPDLYEEGKGFTCTGLAYDYSSNTFLIGDIGILLPDRGVMKSQIVRVSYDFSTVIEIVPLYKTFLKMGDIQGITVDLSDDTIWFCSTSENLIRHISKNGSSIGYFYISNPTGISYSINDDSLWILTLDNSILHVSKYGKVIEMYTFDYDETLDHCFLDYQERILYITAGANYTEKNKIYKFNIDTHEQSIAFTVDSYSVEGIWIGNDQMVIVNDGYYHQAVIPVNMVNIYYLD